jgi:hypothetical protein
MPHRIAVATLGLLLVAARPATPQQAPSTPPSGPQAQGAAKPAGAAAETEAPKPQAAAPNPVQADLKKYTEASRIKDPEKKLDALQKAVDGMAAQSTTPLLLARLSMVETLAKHFPDRTDRIRAVSEQILDSRSGTGVLFAVAKVLVEQGAMLDYATELAHRAVTAFEEENALDTARQRAKYLSVLGLAYVKSGKAAEGEATLREVEKLDATPGESTAGIAKIIDESILSWGADARQAAIAMALSDIAEKQGDLAASAGYLADASMLAPMKAADRKRLEELYRKAHGGSLAGLEEELDRKYRNLKPLPFAVERYEAPPDRTTRAVLAELFTGSACGPCVAADLAFDGLLQRYDRRELILLVYHEHIPGPDPMTNPAAIARGKTYSLASTPVYVINGTDRKTGGGDRPQARGSYLGLAKEFDSLLTTPAGAQLGLRASLEGGQVKATVKVDQIEQPSPDLRLHLVLVEHELSYTGENGIRFHPMVVRNAAGKDFNGFALGGASPQSIDHVFDLAAITKENQAYIDDFVKNPPEKFAGDEIKFSKPMYEMNPNRLSVVAFVQDEKTKQVLQAAEVSLAPAAGPASHGAR